MVAPDVVVHSPAAGAGRGLALEAADRCFVPVDEAPPQPDPCFAVVDGTTVSTCYAMPQAQPDGSVIDFFWLDTVRVENELIVEWWPSINGAAPTQVSWTAPAPATTRQNRDLDGGLSPSSMKQLAVDFYRRVFDSEDPSAVRDFVTEDYVQHSSHLPSGRAGLESLVSMLFPKGPRPTPDPMTLEPTILAAEGDIVVHGVTLLQRAGTRDSETPYPYIVYDAYRVRGDKIAEHWSGVNPTAPPIHGDPSSGRPDERSALP